MKFRKLNSAILQNVNPSRYLIDWDHAVSGPQKKVKDFLRPYWQGQVVLEEFRIPGSKLRIDLFNLSPKRKIVLEVSPAGSHSFNAFFHKSRIGFSGSVKRDLDKQRWAEECGYLYIEIGSDNIDNLSRAWFLEQGVTL